MTGKCPWTKCPWKKPGVLGLLVQVENVHGKIVYGHLSMELHGQVSMEVHRIAWKLVHGIGLDKVDIHGQSIELVWKSKHYKSIFRQNLL
jgi:hypothetical protein